MERKERNLKEVAGLFLNQAVLASVDLRLISQ